MPPFKLKTLKPLFLIALLSFAIGSVLFALLTLMLSSSFSLQNYAQFLPFLILFSLSIAALFLMYENRQNKELKNLADSLKTHDFLRHRDFIPSANTPLVYEIEQSLNQTQTQVQEKIQQLKQQIQNACTLSNKDMITGLDNRNLLLKTLENVIYRTERGHYCSAFFLIDIDDFKQINDHHGHDIGDQLLKQVGQRLQNKVRKTDFCFRFGGDEFIVIYDRLGDFTYQAIEQAEKLANFLHRELNKPYQLNDIQINPTFSIGIQIFNDQSKLPPLKILQHADIALNKAKQSGRNQSLIFEESFLLEVNESALLETSLEKALERNEISWVIQPQVNMKTLEVIGGEVLMRWNHQGRSISPMTFIPIAEQSGLITPMTYWMLKSVFIFVKQHPELFKDRSLAINLSPMMFEDDSLLPELKRLFSQYGIDPSWIKFEITESIFLENIEKVTGIMHQIKSLGCKISLDDFGTGFSSLNYLKTLPIDQLKIDKSFLNQLLTDKKAAAIIKTIIDLTENLEINVIAEGIEIPEQAEYLQSLNCITCQGYLYSKPLAKEDFIQYTEGNVATN
jgi:diguanylate cyclase (GGDEF)-like protein